MTSRRVSTSSQLRRASRVPWALAMVLLVFGYLASSGSAGSVGSAGTISGASQAVCTPSPCTPGPVPVSSPHGAVTVRANNGTGTVIDRYYSVYRPNGLTNSPNNKAPAVLAFGRGAACGPSEVSRLYNELRLQSIADANRFIVVYMTSQMAGAPSLCAWHHPAIDFPTPPRDPLDDEPYVNAVLHDILNKENVDPQRIYATGASSGGAMVQAVACDPTNSLLIRGISAVSEYLPVDISSGRPSGDPRCASANQHLFVQLQGGTADPNVPYGGICIPNHCVSSFAANLDFWRRHLGCTTASTPTLFGSPAQANREQLFTGCAFGTNYGVDGVTVQNGVHAYSGLNDSLNGKTDTNGFVPGQALWTFFSGGLSATSAPAPKPILAKLSLVRVVGTGARRTVRVRVVLGGAATITGTLRKGSKVVAAKVVRAKHAGGVWLVLAVPAKARAGGYSVKLDIRGSGKKLTLSRKVRIPA